MRRAFLKGLALGSVAWREAHRQHQANVAHVWNPPAECHEPDDVPPPVVPASALYVRLRTEGGFEALYGPIDQESVPVLPAPSTSCRPIPSGAAG
jgi:hypothetical protein